MPDYKVEVKNINSFSFVKKAIDYEIERQIEILKKGEKPIQETRGYNEATGKTFSQRTKEEAQDYRYFPEPDLPPLEFSNEEISELKDSLPELPKIKRERFIKDYGLPENYAEILVEDKNRAEYFDSAVKAGQKENISAKTLADLIVNKNLDKEFPEAEGLIAKVVTLTKREYAGERDVEKAALEVVGEEKKAVEDYRNGKSAVLGYLMGRVQGKLKGHGDPQLILTVLKRVIH